MSTVSCGGSAVPNGTRLTATRHGAPLPVPTVETVGYYQLVPTGPRGGYLSLTDRGGGNGPYRTAEAAFFPTGPRGRLSFALPISNRTRQPAFFERRGDSIGSVAIRDCKIGRPSPCFNSGRTLRGVAQGCRMYRLCKRVRNWPAAMCLLAVSRTVAKGKSFHDHRGTEKSCY